VVLPCLGYLADIRKRNSNDTLPLPGAFSDPEGFELGAGVENNPLLASMARHAVGTFVLIGEHGDQYGGWPDPLDLVAESNPAASETLLQRIQRGVRANSPYGNVDGLLADGSLRVHECYGARRELEALRDGLLRAYAEIPDLEPGQILIAAPSLEEYAPLVAAVFHTKENSLPVRLTELPASEGDEVLEGLLALLALARGGRGRASEVLDLLQLRAVREALGVGGDESKIEFLADKLRESGITQGIAGSPEPGSWEFAGDRLVAGMFFGPEEPVPNAAGGFHLPVADSMGANFPDSEAFLEWFMALRATLKEWQTPATPRAWSGRLRTAACELLKGEDGRMEAASGILKFLAEVEAAVPVDVGVAFDWMSSEAAEGSRRAPASGATPFGRLKQLHNTPCRVLALVGMQNDNFPSRASSPSWDLLRAQPKIWDRNARVDDRQMFLDSVLAPTERLIITASTLNIRTNKKQPLSTCVDELLAVAAALGVERKALVLGHPLQPFSKKYFGKAGTLPKPLGQPAAKLAETIHSAKKNKSPLWPGGDGLQPPIPDGIAAESLAAFWRDPAKGFLKAQGIAIPFEGDDDKGLDRSALFPDPLGLWKIKDAMMHGWIEGSGNMDFLKAKLRADRGLPPGSLGEKVWETAKSVVEPIATLVAKAKGSHLELEVPVEVQGRVHTVTGSVLLNSGGDAMVAYRAGKIDDAKDFLGPWITAVLAGAAGRRWPTLVFDETTGATPGQRNAIPQGEALERLKTLVEGYLQGQSRPLCYAPMTSDKLIAGEKQAVAEWTKDDGRSEPGEGRKETSRLAWRDRDTFEKIDDWNAWKEAVAQPLKAWGGF
jgi:exodeoxyribonuclease V gamma subunit